jgi:ABC-2 type transport system ATP-binding protein
MGDPIFDASGLSKAFGHIDALREITLSLSGPSSIGLLDRCPAGKTTLLRLDEPVSNLDPIVRDRFLKFLLEVVQEDAATIVISSHVLHDVESVVDWIVCLNDGRVVENAGLDDLKERYIEWRVAARTRDLPAHVDAACVAHETTVGRRAATLVVRAADADVVAFRQRYDADVDVAPLNLQGLFPALVNGRAH